MLGENRGREGTLGQCTDDVTISYGKGGGANLRYGHASTSCSFVFTGSLQCVVYILTTNKYFAQRKSNRK